MENPKSKAKGKVPQVSKDKPESTAETKRSAKFDESNVVNTFHPENKNYGFMHVDEPATAYVRKIPAGSTNPKTKFQEYLTFHSSMKNKQFRNRLRDVPVVQKLRSNEDLPKLNRDRLMYKMCFAEGFEKVALHAKVSENDGFYETFEERVKRLEFERRRKLHYTEFQTVALARRLIEEEFGDWHEDVCVEETSEFFPAGEYDGEVPCQEGENIEEALEEYSLSFGDTISSSISQQSSGQLTPSHPCYGKIDDDVGNEEGDESSNYNCCQ